MKKSSGSTNQVYTLIPVFGTIIFAALYIFATFLYPGGSQADKNSRGFCWINNYWCNLLNEYAINGQQNAARPLALAAMLILCMAVAFFWYLFPRQVNFGKYTRLTIQFAGTISMAVSLFLFTSLHDLIINTASLFGLIALVGTLNGLYRIQSYKLFWLGLFNFLLAGLNNYFYYTKGMIIYLPVIQKISFAFFLIWLSCINLSLYRKNRPSANGLQPSVRDA